MPSLSQLGAIATNPNDFIIHVLDRFELKEWAMMTSPSLGSTPAAAEPMPLMMEEFIRLVVNIVAECPVTLQPHKRSAEDKDHEVGAASSTSQ